MTLRDLHTPDTFAAVCEAAGARLRTLGVGAGGWTIDAAFRDGDPSLRPILIAAGSHADETSGPEAAVRLLTELETRHPLVIVPFRDPMGARGLAGAFGHLATIATWCEARTLLAQYGRVLDDDGSFLLADLGVVAVAGMAATPDSFGSEKTIKVIQYWLQCDPALVAQLAWKRIVIPANAPDCDARGTLERAYTTYLTDDGFIGSYNRFFGHPAAPVEVQTIAKLIDELQPALAIDLHEGWNDNTYWFVPAQGSANAALAAHLETRVCEALDRNHLGTSSLSDLVPNMPLEHLNRFTPHSHGRLAWQWDTPDRSPWGVALLPYALRHGIAYQTEVGRWNSLERRIEYQLTFSQALVRAFEDRDELG